jgi:protoheme IX farnesyltransferase
VLALALIVFLWTPPHFWSLAILLKDDYQAVGLPMLPRMDDVAFSGRVVVVSAALLIPATLVLVVVGPVTWPALLALVALSVGFLVVSAPLWWSTTKAIARRGFIYSGPYLLGVIAAIGANWALLATGTHPGL